MRRIEGHRAVWVAVSAVAAAVAVVGCSTAAPEQSPPSPTATVGQLQPSEPFGVVTVTLRAPQGGRAVSVPAYDAYTSAARQRGLMGREQLPADAGMVFRFNEDRTGGFWMKNTLIPLGIAFFDSDGTVVAVRRMKPCTADPCPSYEPEAAYRGALEVNEAYLDEVGLAQGWRVEVPNGLPPPE